MTYVIAEPCIGEKDRACVDVCPVDCIVPDPDHVEGPDELHLKYQGLMVESRSLSENRSRSEGKPF